MTAPTLLRGSIKPDLTRDPQVDERRDDMAAVTPGMNVGEGGIDHDAAAGFDAGEWGVHNLVVTVVVAAIAAAFEAVVVAVPPAVMDLEQSAGGDR